MRDESIAEFLQRLASRDLAKRLLPVVKSTLASDPEEILGRGVDVRESARRRVLA